MFKKKVLPMVLCLCMVLTTLVMPSLGAAAADEGKVFFSRSFQGPSPFNGMNPVAKSNIIKTAVDSGDNQYVVMQMAESPSEDMFIDYTLTGAGKNVVISADFSTSGNPTSFQFQYKDVNNNSSYFTTADASGLISTYNERNELGQIEKGKWLNIAVAADFNEGTTQFYVDGEPVGEPEALKDPACNSISLFRIYVGGSNAAGSDLLVDNLQIYEGTEPREVPYEDEGGENVPSEFSSVRNAEGEVGQMLFYNRTYEEADQEWSAGLALSPKSNSIELSEEDGNHFIKISRLQESTEDVFFDMNLSNPTRFLVMQMDFSYSTPNTSATIWQYKDANSQTGYILAMSGGNIQYRGTGEMVGTAAPGEWTNVAIAIDFQTSSADVYVNNEIVLEGVGLANPDYTSISSLRTYLGGGENSKGTDFYVDNLKVYEGKEPREVKEGELPPKQSIVPENNDLALAEIAKLGDENIVLVNVDAGTIFYDGEKHKLDVAPYYSNDRTLVPLRAISEAFGCEVGWDEATKTATIDGETKVTIGETTMQLPGGKTYELDVPAEQTGDRTFLPLRALGEQALGKAVTWDSRGLILIGSREFSSDEADFEEINNFMLYDRPTAQQALDAFNATSAGQHPRVLTDAAGLERIKADYAAGNPYIKKWGDSIIASSDKVLNAKMPFYNIADGLRLSANSSAGYTNAKILAMAYILTGDAKYPDRLYQELETVANYNDWNPGHYLDTATISSEFAIAYDWLFDYWTDEQKSVIREAIYKHSLDPTLKSYYNQGPVSIFWATCDHNWNIICNGGTTMAAIAVMDDYPEEAADLISKASRSAENMMNSFYPEGAWMEGPGYWNYLMQYLPMMFTTFDTALGTDFNLSAAPGMANTAYFPLASQGPTGTNNFHDASVSYICSPASFWLSTRFNDPNVTKVKLYQMDKYNQGGNMFDMLWYDTSITDLDVSSMKKDFYYQNVEFVSMRNSWTNDDGVFLSFHAGETNVNHYHIDTGSYVLDMLGQRFVMDIGGEDYNLPGMFGNLRNNYYRNRPEGHNLYVINPSDGKPGQALDAFCKVEMLESSPRGAYSIADLSNSYAGYVTEARRGYMIGDDRRSATVRDEFSLVQDSELYWFVHTDADIELVDDTTAILTKNGASIKAMLTTNLPDGKLAVMDAVPLPSSPVMEGQNANAGIQKLYVHTPEASGDVVIQIKFVPADDPVASKAPEDIALDQWKNQEGELQDIPTIDMVYADGAALSEFEPTRSAYVIKMPYDAAAPKTITAEGGDDCTIEVQQATAFGEPTKIVVKNAVNPDLVRTYSVVCELAPKLSDVGGMTRYQVIGTEASENPEEANPHYNVSDDNVDTRWAAETDGAWVQIDLGEVKPIDAIGVSMMKADERIYTFELEVSEDGENWTTVRERGTNSQATNEIVLYPITRVNARYVRYIGHGNSVNNWNSITELAALVNP